MAAQAVGSGVALRTVGDLGDWNVVGAEGIFAPLAPVNWLCKPVLIAPGAPTIFAGYGYSGKSVASGAMALSVATGRPLWEKFIVRQGRVLHLDYEQGRRLTFERYQRMAFALAVDPSEVEGNLEVGVLPGKGLDTLDDLSRFGEGRALCLVDSWRAAHPSVDENSSDVRPTLDRMGRASEKTGCAFVFLHHTRKPSKDAGGGAKMGIRGSSGFYDGCQTVYLFDGEVTGHPVVTLVKDRVMGTKELEFSLAVEDSDGGRGLRVRYEAAQKAPEETPATRFESLVADVCACVLANPGLAGADVVALRLGRRASEVRAVVASLVAEGRLKSVGTGGKGRAVKLYDAASVVQGDAPF